MTLQLWRIQKCQWTRGWYVQLTARIKPITNSKLKFKWMCFPRGVSRCFQRTRSGETQECVFNCTPLLPTFSHSGAVSHQAEAEESHLLVLLVLQLLPGKQRLWILLQVLSSP